MLIIGVLVTTFLLGMATERIRLWAARPPLTPTTLATETVSVITLSDLNSQTITATAHHQPARLQLNDSITHLEPEQDTVIDLTKLLDLDAETSLIAPSWAQYTADTKTNYFYPTDSSAALRIPADRRKYFRTSSSAATAGFVRGTRNSP